MSQAKEERYQSEDSGKFQVKRAFFTEIFPDIRPSSGPSVPSFLLSGGIAADSVLFKGEGDVYRASKNIRRTLAMDLK